MRLHHLEFRGLGPFRDTQLVDFADLAASGLFLLEGPTGAGKSTVIDAIVFALYGSVAGATSDRGRLVSHFLEGGAAPFAELVFTTAAGTHRIRRTPTYEAPKARGTGTTTRNATVTLTRLTGPHDTVGEPLSTSQREAGDEVIRIVGLTKEQFVGTIVLPQGEFASFLRAEGRDRLPILQRIFRTEPYERLQRRLWEAKAEAERARGEADQALEVALGAFHGAAGSAPDDPAWAGVDAADGDALAAAMEAGLAGLAVLASAAEATASCTAEALQRATADHAAVQARVSRRDRLRAARQREAAVLSAAAEHAANLDRLAAAQRAQRVADALAACAAAELEAARAGGADEAARAELTPVHAALPVDELRGVLDETRTLVAVLEPLAAVEAGLAERAADLERCLAQGAAAREQVASRAARLASLPERRAALVGERDAAQARAALVPSCEAELARCLVRHEAAEQLPAAEGAIALAQQAAAEQVAGLDAAERHARELAERYRAGIAAELAVGLAPEQPCPVCGSCAHPAPARADRDHVGHAQVRRAEAEVRVAREAVESARAELASAQQRGAELLAAAAGLGRDEARQAMAAAQQALAEALAADAALAVVDRTLAGLAEEERELQEGHAEALARSAAAAAEASGLEGGLLADREAVAAALAGHPSVADRVALLRAQLAGLRRAEQAGVEWAAARTALATASAVLGTALAREGFAEAELARLATLPADEAAALGEQVRRHEEERAAVAGLLAEPELAGVDPDEVIDTAPTEQALAEARGAHDEAVAARGRAAARLAEAAGRASGVRAAAEDRDTCVRTTEPLLAVARLASGRNVLSMDLATYVLQRRFDLVVAAANEHLRVMSDGALALASTDEAEGRARRAGLGLRVLDLRTGQERSPRTLSGGETFYTALALALGLASVVTGEAGGVDLGTLFVDEGFGSLDHATLDDVLAVLTSLRAGGRVIGVVSHVEEMKQRIPERIEVRRDDVAGHSAIRVVA